MMSTPCTTNSTSSTTSTTTPTTPCTKSKGNKKHLCLCPICLAKKAKKKAKKIIKKLITPPTMISWTGDVTLTAGATPAVGDTLAVTSVTTDNSGGKIVLNADGTITINQNGNYMVSMAAAANPDLSGSALIGLFDSPSGLAARASATLVTGGLVGVTAPMLMVPAISASTTLVLKVITTTGFTLSATAASTDAFTLNIVQIS